MASRKSAKPSLPTQAPGAPAKGKGRPKTDWQAVERDYRTGKFSDQELADKHGNTVTRQAISKRAKTHGWQKDLSVEVRQATRASLIREEVAKKVASEVAKGCATATTATTDVVLAAAEVNKQVILGHRTDLRSTRAVATSLLAELADAALLDEHKELLSTILAGEGAQEADLSRARIAVSRAVNLGTRVSSVKALADAFTKIQAAERVAFGLDEKEDDKAADPIASLLAGMRSALPVVKNPEGEA